MKLRRVTATPTLTDMFQFWMHALADGDAPRARETAAEYFAELVISDLRGPGHLPLSGE